jgi:hypothetical protein
VFCHVERGIYLTLFAKTLLEDRRARKMQETRNSSRIKKKKNKKKKGENVNVESAEG